MTQRKVIGPRVIFLLVLSFNFLVQTHAQSPSDYRNYAETLLIKHNLKPSAHTVLVSNISYILKNLVKVKEISMLEKMSKPQIQNLLFTKSFWGQKLHREISIPYSDTEFRQYLADLQTELNSFIKYLNTINSDSSEYELEIFGSMAKARFGVNSSLDILVRSSDRKLLSKLDSGIYSANHPKFRGNIKLITSNNESYFLLDPFYKVTTGELSNLAKIYQDVLESNNLMVKQNNERFKVTFTNLPAKFNLEFNAIEDRMFFLLNKLNKLESSIENSTELFIPVNHKIEVKTRKYFLDQMQNLSLNLKRVKTDLDLVIQHKNSPRHNQIKGIIEPASYARLKGYRGQRMLALIEQKLILIEKNSQMLR